MAIPTTDDARDLRPITLTIYLSAVDGEDPYKWNVAEWLDDPTVVGWDITEGHGACRACEEDGNTT